MNTEHLDRLWSECFDEREGADLGARGELGTNHADKIRKSIDPWGIDRRRRFESTALDRSTHPCRECPEGMEW